MQIDPIVLNFPIFLALGNGGAQSVDFGSQICKIGGFRPSNFIGVTYEQNIQTEDKTCQDTPRSWQGFAKIGPGTSKNLWWGKKKIKLEMWANA